MGDVVALLIDTTRSKCILDGIVEIFGFDPDASILRYGLLSYNEVQRRGSTHVTVAEAAVQRLRRAVTLRVGAARRPLHDFVPLYFATRTPMLYRRRSEQADIVYVYPLCSICRALSWQTGTLQRTA
jgi:hypothetical protein